MHPTILTLLTDVSARCAVCAHDYERLQDDGPARIYLDSLADQVEVAAEQVPYHLTIIRGVVDEAHRLVIEARVALDQADPARAAELVPALLRVADSRLCHAFHALGAMQAGVACVG